MTSSPELVASRVRAARLALEKARERLGRRPVLMEVCGTHTVSLSRSGIRSLVADLADLKSGPGCPVCVTSARDIDAIGLLAASGAGSQRVIATFGDLMRVPGSRGSLETMRAGGARIAVVYSPLAAVELAAREPGADVIFIGVGFETTAPAVALAIKAAAGAGLQNFSIFSAHKLTPPAVDALLRQGGVGIDGFLLPGHVSTVIGVKPWEFVAARWGLPAVVAGFQPPDLLEALRCLGDFLADGRAALANGYPRAVRAEGNPEALRQMADVFALAAADWRGIGIVPESGLVVRPAWRQWDAAARFARLLAEGESRPDTRGGAGGTAPTGCRCGEVLRGRIRPDECALFGRACTPFSPVGPCMVSSEGACACYFQYREADGQ